MRISVFIVAVILSAAPVLSAWGGKPADSSYNSAHPNVHQVNMRLKAQWRLIQQEFKSGKLTKEQTDTLRANLKSIRQQESSFLKQNGNHELTVDQKNQLNTLLDKNSQPLGENTSTSN